MPEKAQTISSLQEVVEKLGVFFADKGGALLVFLFGSTVSGKATETSDIDVAVLFSKAPDVYAANELRDELAAFLKKETDVAVLNDASPILKMQVLKHGALVFKRTSASYNQFFVDTLNQYDDLKQIRKISEENILKGRIYAR
jgi:predicted nucleotidyltransferase